MHSALWTAFTILISLHFTHGHNVYDEYNREAFGHNAVFDHGHSREALLEPDYIGQQPPAVRKMTDDEGEMFFLHYWQDIDANMTHRLLPPLLPHSNSPTRNNHWGLAGRLFKRDFQCPAGTLGCSSINQPDSCCLTGETCIVVQDTGLGPVGCCPSGQTCSGTVSSCNTAEGYTSCPGSPNGGCCIPGYTCEGVGCIVAGTTIVSPNPTTTSSYTTTATSTTASPPPGVSTYTTTINISASASVITATTTVTQTTSSATTTTASAVAPIRLTSDSSVATTSTTETTAASTEGSCPTNFYRCSAYYEGGCCRVGRDCSSTSCVAASSSTLTSDSQATIIGTSGTLSGSCADGWQSCAASVGGGCCPGGYVCGTATCSATAAGTSSVDKISGGVKRGQASGLVVGLVLWWIADVLSRQAPANNI